MCFKSWVYIFSHSGSFGPLNFEKLTRANDFKIEREKPYDSTYSYNFTILNTSHFKVHFP